VEKSVGVRVILLIEMIEKALWDVRTREKLKVK